MPKNAQFRFYEELNDFLPPEVRKKEFPYQFTGKPSVKDAVEAIGVPHTEIDLILINGASVRFDQHLRDGDFISVYPVFESLDIQDAVHLRPEPLRVTRFILDTHLGKLACYLRMLGFDAAYRTGVTDSELIAYALSESRIILTRDTGLLKHKDISHACYVHATQPRKQVTEVLTRLDLISRIKPFTRCMSCNGLLKKVKKEDILDELEPNTRKHYEEFYRCSSCGKIYWKGSHYENMKHFIKTLTEDAE